MRHKETSVGEELDVNDVQNAIDSSEDEEYISARARKQMRISRAASQFPQVLGDYKAVRSLTLEEEVVDLPASQCFKVRSHKTVEKDGRQLKAKNKGQLWENSVNQSKTFDSDEDSIYEDDILNSKFSVQKPNVTLGKGCNTISQGTKKISASLLATSHKLRIEAELHKPDELAVIKEQEEQLLQQVSQSLNAPLTSVKERAKGIIYTERLKTSWNVPSKYMKMSESEVEEVRKNFLIETSGNDVPPPFENYKDMRLPKVILDALKMKGISRPTQIQMQGIPAVLLGRDLIGIAFTGSGKTLVFSIPMIMGSLESEMRKKYMAGEGPWGLVVCPSRELATQTTSVIQYYTDSLSNNGYPALRSICMIGGSSVQDQVTQVKKGVHMVVATPGRLNDMLAKRRMSLQQCRFLCLDEADRMIDLGFEDEVRSILDYFSHQRQTLLFSATMPRKIQEFAKSALVDPIMVNVGRAGAANLDVIQEVEYVKQEAKLPYLLQCLQKTIPPVLIFCENKKDVDDVNEYLLLKGVDACAIHGGLSQDERQGAISLFRSGTSDVLVGTDVASKGLDFPAIQHVINFDMPREIESYVHRIGRTGRCGRTGIATTFINKNQEETVLLDLKALLIEAQQKIPPFLEALDTEGISLKDIGGIRGCAFCGGLGHRIAQCPKLETQKNKKLGTNGKDYLMNGNRYGGTIGYVGDW